MNPLRFFQSTLSRFARLPHALHALRQTRDHERWVQDLFRHLSDYRPDPDRSETVVIATVRDSRFFVLLHQLIALVLARRGCRVVFLMDDGLLAHEDTVRGHEVDIEQLVAAHEARQRAAPGLRRRLKRQWRSNRFPEQVILCFYSELLGTDSRTRVRDHVATASRSLAAGSLSPDVQASHNRFFGGRDFEPGHPGHVAYAGMSITNEAVGREVAARVMEQFEPERLIVLDGIYSTFGVLTRCLREAGVAIRIHKPVGTYTPDVNERMLAITEKPFALSNDSRAWKHYVVAGYDERERALARRLVAARMKRSADRGDAGRWVQSIREKSAGHRRVIGLFPNLTWDANVPERDSIFSGMAAWLQETVEWAARARVFVVLREHPQSRQAFNLHDSAIAMLKERMPGLDDCGHVLLIPGLEAVSSYDLIEEVIDCSVVYDGTLGLEAALLRCPVVLASNSAFTGKQLAFEPESRAEYFDLLASMSRRDDRFVEFRDRSYENAVRAAGFQFGSGLYHCPIAPRRLPPPGQGFNYDDFKEVSPAELNPARNPEWNRCIEGFLE